MTPPVRSLTLAVVGRRTRVTPGETLPEPNHTRSDAALRRRAMEQEELSTELAALLPRLWRFALRLAGDRHDAEDLVQRMRARARAAGL